MSTTVTTPLEQPAVGSAAASPQVEAAPERNFWTDLMVSVATQSWLASMAFHMLLMIVLALIMGTIQVASKIGVAPEFAAVEEQLSNAPEIERFDVGYTPLEPTELNTETLTLTEAPAVDAEFNDNSPEFNPAGGGLQEATSPFGGLGGITAASLLPGPALKAGGLDASPGLGKKMGKGGAAEGFNFRGTGSRDAIVGAATKQSERAVAAALNWLARHQNRDGSWSLKYTHNCKGGFCSGPGEHVSDTAATALGLLPFLAAGQTHETKGPYQKNILQGINWLIKNQRPTGDLTNGSQSQMYSHGLATIALCEAYGMTQDSRIGYAAQAAINFIESGQNREGGWRYRHGSEDSDTSVFGWQVMALKSGQMAGLKVNPAVMQGCKSYLNSCARGPYKCEFSYMPGGGATYSMTSVGLLTSQYLGAKRDDPVVAGGIDYLIKRKPDISQRDVYYWYYATQVMHNVPGREWDEWNRQMRRILIETQDKEKNTCQAGSWNPNQPEPDRWGNHGGRLMITSLSALTLEVYYRYLPLYQLDNPEKDLSKLNKVE